MVYVALLAHTHAKSVVVPTLGHITGAGTGVGTNCCGVCHFTETKPAAFCTDIDVSASTVPDSALLQVPTLVLPFQKVTLVPMRCTFSTSLLR